MSILEGKNILLGVTGSIACYKAADLASKLTQAGANVDVILTQSALQFISPLTFQSVTGRYAYTDKDLWGNTGHVTHVGLGHQADIFVIAPATANTLAKLAHGIADNLLTVTALAAKCPLLVAPAMDGGMYQHPATQSNVADLQARGAVIAGPDTGHLASGQIGVGRMLEPGSLFGHIRQLLGRGGPLEGYQVLVTAGGTQEIIDPVRVITNRSSGKQGYAIAQMAIDMGAAVTLITTPVCLEPPVGVKRICVETAAQMEEAVLAEAGNSEILIMAAAVADFKPADPARVKLKKELGMPTIRLEKTSDILAMVAKQKEKTGWPKVTIGFAAESNDLLENAQKKLVGKRLDLIAANDITADDAGFGANTNRIVLLDTYGNQENLPLMEKERAAEIILNRAVKLLAPDT